MSSDERVLRYIAAIVAIVGVCVIAVADVVVNHTISPAITAIIGGPILLVIMLIAARPAGGGGDGEDKRGKR